MFNDIQLWSQNSPSIVARNLAGSNLSNQFAITVFFSFKWFSVFQWFSVPVQQAAMFLKVYMYKSIYQSVFSQRKVVFFTLALSSSNLYFHILNPLFTLKLFENLSIYVLFQF